MKKWNHPINLPLENEKVFLVMKCKKSLKKKISIATCDVFGNWLSENGLTIPKDEFELLAWKSTNQIFEEVENFVELPKIKALVDGNWKEITAIKIEERLIDFNKLISFF